METLTIYEDFITLGQALKELGLIQTGGQAKYFLAENDGRIFYNGEVENRRGKKIYPGDQLELPDFDIQINFFKADDEEIAQRNEIKQLENNFKIKAQLETASNRIKLKSSPSAKKNKPRSPFHK
ncbi:S4 domain-containing protein YaaA [Lactovum miscens]|uniref:S4 domain protein YaaA n=1 Tax=Lactovum miscens TaxID=190387 RepID=A0A841C3I9_9LACT|nr:S4 domain-containing protein YaaA [Lactovum miscens]MBB5887393.1 S4 domain protein YaaA [Lactovum miscens]